MNFDSFSNLAIKSWSDPGFTGTFTKQASTTKEMKTTSSKSKTSDILIGAQLSHYLFLEKIAESTQATIYKVQDVRIHKTYVAKFVDLTNPETKSELLEMFAMESQILKDCRNINGIIHFIDIMKMPDFAFIVMEYMPLCLKEFQVTLFNAERSCLARRVAIFLVKTCSKLHELGYKHNDIKPENILMDSTFEQFKLVDFGLSETTTNCSGNILGTVPFIAPERYWVCAPNMFPPPRANIIVDERVDTWAIGMTIYEIWFLRRPFSSIFYNSSSNMNLKPQSHLKPADFDVEALKKEIHHILNDPIQYPSYCKNDEDLFLFLQTCLEKDERKRPNATKLLSSPVFQKLNTRK